MTITAEMLTAKIAAAEQAAVRCQSQAAVEHGKAQAYRELLAALTASEGAEHAEGTVRPRRLEAAS